MMRHSLRLAFLILLLLLGACRLPASQAPKNPVSPIDAPASPSAQTPGVPGAGATESDSLIRGEVQTPHPSPTLSRSPSPASTPGWCPLPKAPPLNSEGKLRIAFTSSRDAWLWEEGGQPVRLTQSGNVENPLLSDDGLLFVFTRRPGKGQAEIWVMDLGSRKESMLASAQQLASMRTGDAEKDTIAVTPANLQWVPGTHRLAFNTYPVLKNPGLWIYIPDDLWLVDADNKDITASIQRGEGGEAIFSPDGSRAAILRLQGMDILDLSSGILKKDVLPGYVAIPEGESYFYPWPAWTTDSAALLLALPESTDLYTSQASARMWRVPAAGGPARSLGSLPAFSPSVSFSPDRLSVAFWRGSQSGTNLRELSVVRLDGLERAEAASGEQLEFLGWSPDATKFIYTQGNPPSAFLGGPCRPPQALPGIATLPLSLRWVDAERYLFIVPTQGPYELRLNGPQGSQTLAQMWGEEPGYDFALTSRP